MRLKEVALYFFAMDLSGIGSVPGMSLHVNGVEPSAPNVKVMLK
jgi:hypothetical protein